MTSIRRSAAALASLVTLAGAVLAGVTPAGAETEPADPTPTAVAAPAPVGHAATASTMTFVGRGWGHGRGLSQWGAQGYATVHGWTSAQILDHYYGGTHAGPTSQATSLPVDPSAIRIRLIAQDGKPTVIGINDGTLSFSGSPAVIDPGGLTALRLTRIVEESTNEDHLLIESATNCDGPWTPVGDGLSEADTITVTKVSGPNQLHLCRDDGVRMWYPGKLRATLHNDFQRTVNITSVEAQLRSVVPRESPASWDSAALEAQSVAARSYALAGDSRNQPYADTCDTTLCQVYAGHFRKDPGGTKTPTTHTRTDAAITATADIVRLTSTNKVARTEFSSTSGGWTAGGTFPAVEDLGDSISPLHTWNRTVAVTGLETTYGEGGTLVGIDVLARNGLGADGGRVTSALLRFSNGTTATVSGNTVRSKVQLLSDWFTPTCPTEGRYINAVYTLFLKRPATGAEVETWCAAVRKGDRFPLTDALAVSDEWAGVQISELYQKILRRTADAGGRAYWLELVADGLRIEDIAAEFYGSPEYFKRAGSTNAGFVDRLYVDLLGRTADTEGRDFWVRLLDTRSIDRTGAASEFYASIESRTDRVNGLFRTILLRQPDVEGRRYWVGQLLDLGDVSLAAWLAASDEYYQRSIR